MQSNKEILIGKYLSGNASPEEIGKLMSWLKENPLNQAEFDKVEKFWKLSINLKKEEDTDVEKAWAEFKTLAERQSEIKVVKTNSSWLRIAAAVALFIVMGIVVKVFFINDTKISTPVISQVAKPLPKAEPVLTPSLTQVADTIMVPEPVTNNKSVKRQSPPRKSVGMITISTTDSAKIFLLPDNSIVYLNANSKLEYPDGFNKTNRRVSLVGEAYFEIKKDSGQFVVACENTITRGKGCAFNIKSHSTDKEVEVIVASGKAEFSGIGYKDFKKLTIKSGESGVYKKDKSTISKSKFHRKNYKWWQAKSLKAKIKRFFDKLTGKKSGNKSINPGK